MLIELHITLPPPRSCQPDQSLSYSIPYSPLAERLLALCHHPLRGASFYTAHRVYPSILIHGSGSKWQ